MWSHPPRDLGIGREGSRHVMTRADFKILTRGGLAGQGYTRWMRYESGICQVDGGSYPRSGSEVRRHVGFALVVSDLFITRLG